MARTGVDPPLSLRALNRATLARQHLIEPLPAGTSVGRAVDQVGPLQSQYNPSPFVALRARVDGFGRDDLRLALDELRVVKASLTRGTLHVVSAAEYPWYAAASGRLELWQKMLGAAVDVEVLRDDLLAYVDGGSRSFVDLRDFISTWVERNRRPGVEIPSTSNWFIVRTYPWLVRTPETTRIDAHPRDCYLTARTVLPTVAAEGSIDEEDAFVHIVRSYLAAYGPAEAEDVKSFFLEPRITRVRAALARLEPELVTLAGEDGATLYDLASAPRPSPDVEVPVRFIARFDNLLMGQAPRNRIRALPEEHRAVVFQSRNGQVLATYLVDGMVAGTWDVKRVGRRTQIVLRSLARLTKARRAEVEREAAALAEFLLPADRPPEVVVETP
jgi:Winged helix DNA-binding domain